MSQPLRLVESPGSSPAAAKILYTPLWMQLCAITDRKHAAAATEGEAVLRRRLSRLAGGWIAGGVNFIQLREKDLDPGSLRSLAEDLAAQLSPKAWGPGRGAPRLLVNLPASADWLRALAPIADGVHIPGVPAPGAVEKVRCAFRSLGRTAVVSVSCHSLEDIETARNGGADFALFAPVFEKARLGEKPVPGQGLAALGRACKRAQGMPVLALGGVTVSNAGECLAAGAAGIAGIRLFAQEGWERLAH